MEPDGDSKAAVHDAEADSATRRAGLGLCLSGGGFRATLFHLGVLRRLFELGVTARPDFDTVTSVSGGSLTVAQWAKTMIEAPSSPQSARMPLERREDTLDFDKHIAKPILALTAKDLRTGPLAKKFFLPWNWFRGAYAPNAMVARFETAFGQATLDTLPERPRFVFCATDMAFGANFVFERDRVGSYLAGYAPPKGFKLAQAVAASACFPPLFGPLRIERAAERFKGGRSPGHNAEARKRILQDLRVTDGGVYDNMGLEPVWKSHRVVLVSDAGGLMDAAADRSFSWRIRRYQSIQEAQARGARKRFLISGYCQGTIKGAYIGVGSAVARYRGARDAASYSKAFAMEVIGNIRTDLDAFSGAEQAVLVNHGYALIDAALRTHVPELITTDAPLAPPFPEYAPGAMNEDELRRRLAGSEKRKFLGRR